MRVGNTSGTGGTWYTLDGGTNRSGIASGSNSARQQTFTLPNASPYSIGGTNVAIANDTRVCFRGYASPVAGQSTPTSTTTDAGPRYTDIRCVRVYNPPPTVSAVTAGCATFAFTVADANAHRVDVTLVSDGAARTESEFILADQAITTTGTSLNFATDSWQDFTGHSFAVRVRDSGPLGDTFATTASSTGVCLAMTCGVEQPGLVEVGRQYTVWPTFKVVARTTSPDYTDAGLYIGSRGTEVGITSITASTSDSPPHPSRRRSRAPCRTAATPTSTGRRSRSPRSPPACARPRTLPAAPSPPR